VGAITSRADTLAAHSSARSRGVSDDLVCPHLYRTDPIFRLLLGRWRLGEQGVAMLTLVLGFGVLSAWYLVSWALDPATRCRRGPFEYYSATLGDLLLIPLLNAIAVRYLCRVVGGLCRVAAATQRGAWRLLALVERAYNAPLGRTFALAVMAAAVALEHLDELYGLDRNRTVPEWGRPRLSALYHQSFFACETLIVASLAVRHIVTTRLLLRLARNGSYRSRLRVVAEQSQRLYGWVLLGWGAFVSLRVTDFFYLTPSVSLQAIAALPAPLTVLAVYYLALIGTGVIPAVAVTRRYELGWAHAPLLLMGACLLVPIAGPAVRILVARLLAV
jgi:hypothetical protein